MKKTLEITALFGNFKGFSFGGERGIRTLGWG